MKTIATTLWTVVLLLAPTSVFSQSIDLRLRHLAPTSEGSKNYHRVQRDVTWNASETAVIVCDMWDSHHCVNAVRRVSQLAPRINDFCNALRQRGVTIIHAPSGCMETYQSHPARTRATAIPAATAMPDNIGSWCDQIPSEESAAYPIDQSQGGEDDDPEDHRLWAERLEATGRNPRAPWTAQTDLIKIDSERDYISDSGTEIWSVLTAGKIENVILVGVHTNMCVLGRPFGLRRLASAGKNVVLARDLTDTMYDPRAWPYVSHFTGTDLIVDHIERYVCPTITSDQILGGDSFRFAGDQRKHLLMLIAEDEYETDKTLPLFAAKHLGNDFRVSFAWGSETERHQIVGADDVAHADALLISVRRRALPKQHLELIRKFVEQSKPVIGIRTANHAFSLRGKETPDGKAVWDSFDADVFGGNYTNHYGSGLTTTVQVPEDADRHVIVASTDTAAIRPGGSLYRVSPLAAGTKVLAMGVVPDQAPEPIAWTFIRSDGGRSFYTSMGHPSDFRQPEFESLLAAGIRWACGLDSNSLAKVKQQNDRYANGDGKQRK